MPNIGPLEIALVLVIVLVIFGPKRLPEMGRSLGRGIREFKNSLTRDHPLEDDKPALSQGEPQKQAEDRETVQTGAPDG